MNNNCEAEKITFCVTAEKYFEMDADRLEEVRGTGDYCKVNIYPQRKGAEYCHIPEHPYAGNPGNYPYEQDDYSGVVELMEEVAASGEMWDYEEELK